MNHIVLLSGGIDSTVTLAKVIHDHGDVSVTAIWVNYGQRLATMERNAVIQIARAFGVELRRIAIVPPLVAVEEVESIPTGTYDEIDVVREGLYLPARNTILLGLAAYLAWPEGKVYYGAHAADTPYADCKLDYVVHMKEAVKIGTYGKVEVEAPLISMTKPEIIRLGQRLKVPFHLTYSCYNGRELHCGKCPTCIQRREAFAEAGVEDPTIYER